MLTFEEFLDAELVGLRRYAAVLTGDRQQAHDILAEALLKAHTQWSRICAMEFALAYVRRMVTSTFVSEKRRWSVRMIRPTNSGELPEQAAPDPTLAADDRAQLHNLLSALPPRQRAAVVLRYYLGLDNAEIAGELGITEGAVRTAISRALGALRIAVSDGESTVWSQSPEQAHEGTVTEGAVAANDALERTASYLPTSQFKEER